MSWITVIWSMAAAACLTLAAVHLVVWWTDRRASASLLFSTVALGIAALAGTEMWMMRAETTAEFATALRWVHLPAWIIVVGMVGFVRTYLQAGRLWLLWAVIGLRSLALLLNFLTGTNLNYRVITELRPVSFLGESIAIPAGVSNPWMLVGQASLLLFCIFVADASLAVWRRGDRRQALVVGGSMVFFTLTAVAQSIIVLWGIKPWPLSASLCFLPVIAAMGFQLSGEVLHAAQRLRDLRESEQRMDLAAAAAQLGIWSRDLVRNEMWATAQWRALFGFTPDERLDFDRYLQRLHPDDRATVQQGLTKAIETAGHYELDYRVVRPDGSVRWIASRGRVELNAAGRPALIRGVSVDITPRREAELEIQRNHAKLAHLSRVASLGELSGSLAHEINQPLSIILSNAQAAQRLLAQTPPDIAEVRDIINDIINADRRAGEVIKRLRALLKHGEPEQKALSLHDVIDEVLALMRSDFIARGVSITRSAGPAAPVITGDRIPLQQVLLNLFTNACDAMVDNPPGDRRLTVETRFEDGWVKVSIRDNGCGLPAETGRIFEPFFTTKTHGLGMGLAICRTIINAHGGRLWAERNSGTGTTFLLELPLAEAGP